MTPDDILDRLRQLYVPHEEIAKVIGTHRVQATKMLNGQRRMLASELAPLAVLVGRWEAKEGVEEEKTDDKLTEAEMAELLDLMSSCTGIGIKAPDVTISFDDIFTAGKFFDRLHKAVRRRWHGDR